MVIDLRHVILSPSKKLVDCQMSRNIYFFSLSVLLMLNSCEIQKEKARSPIEDLPPWIEKITHFGQRADFSHDGKRILFLEKTFGDVYEVEIKTKEIRPVTLHYLHEGYTRALYLSNGDILLSGARKYDAEDPWPSREITAELLQSRYVEAIQTIDDTKCDPLTISLNKLLTDHVNFNNVRNSLVRTLHFVGLVGLKVGPTSSVSWAHESRLSLAPGQIRPSSTVTYSPNVLSCSRG